MNSPEHTSQNTGIAFIRALSFIVVFFLSNKSVAQPKADTISVLKLIAFSDSAAAAGNYDSSLYYAQKANILAGQINYLSGKKKALLKCGIANMVLYENETALKNYDEAIGIAKQTGDKKSEAEINISKGWALAKFDFSKAIVCFKRGLELATEVKDITLTAKSNWGISESYSALGNYPEAINYSFKAIRFFEVLKQYDYVSLIYSSQGYVYERQNSFKEAFKAYEKSLQLAIEAKNNALIANAYSSLGQLDFNNNLLDDALTKYNRALKIFNEDWENYKTNIADCYESISRVLEKKADFKLSNDKTEEAKDYYLQSLEKSEAALELFEQGGLKIGMAASYNHIGAIYLKLKEYKKANIYVDKGLELAKEINGMAELKDSYYNLAAMNENTGDYKMAYRNYKMHILYRDSLLNEENTKKTVQSQMQYESDKKEALTKAEQEKRTP
ncbi:MAG: tetratricopeptide repeat protein [Bacteroidetes bacterium]|nr:tetratricopeptide repeat protein [Bacteroidota bacterium]